LEKKMTSTTKSYIDLSKAVDPTKAPHVPFQEWGLGGSAEKNVNESIPKPFPSPIEVHGRRGTMVILMAGVFYTGIVLFLVYMAKAALG
jgi:hypothetical protein